MELGIGAEKLKHDKPSVYAAGSVNNIESCQLRTLHVRDVGKLAPIQSIRCVVMFWVHRRGTLWHTKARWFVAASASDAFGACRG